MAEQKMATQWAAALGEHVRALLRDLLAGLVGSVALIANVVSFAALMFPGALSPGAPVAVWAMLVGGGITGIWLAWRTSLPPTAAVIDSATGAVLVLLSASAGAAVLAAGGSTQTAVNAVLLLFTATTLLTGALLLALGLLRWGHYMRFVPSFVVAGFLAATGCLLLAGGVRMSSGHAMSELFAPWSGGQLTRLACAAAMLGLMLALRRWVRSGLAMPIALLAVTAAGHLLLHRNGLASAGSGWYLPSPGALVAWSPLDAARSVAVPWALLAGFVPELAAAAVVALVSIVTKTATLESMRKTTGDLDCELREHGVATLAAAPLGGIAACVQLGSSRLLEQAGGAARRSGVFCGAILLLVGLTHADVPALVPLPVVAGLMLYLGWNLLVEALARLLAQRAWLDLLLSVSIAAACVRYGYLAGVIGGVVGACLLFAASCARTGVVRQHLSRAQFTGNVSRTAADERYLADHGERIQIYWLAGHVFFGSGEGLFERVRRDLDARASLPVSHVLLDFGLVTGVDASAVVSLSKLRNHCDKRGTVLLLAAMAPAVARALGRNGSVAAPQGGPPPFADLNTALAWCEERVLERAGRAPDAGEDGFEAWLQSQLGTSVSAEDFIAYLERHEVASSQVLYAQGDDSDEIDLVAAGRLVVDVTDANTGRTVRTRVVTTCSVVGEMGFFRGVPRSATVSTEGPASRYTLTRAAYERMRRERPAVAIAFDTFLLRTLSDRINVADRMVAALAR
ncbi:SulP family inorganic anion transporter [Paucibacter sp. M5-1]|uniref:SulP family inorganic anion transporter n=1 Tax=Paucibacter sp. M5-1 TaxID=3015998 RepID=UPI003F7D3CA1